MNVINYLFHSLFHTLLRIIGIKRRFKSHSTVLKYIKNEQKKPLLKSESLLSLKLKSSLSKKVFNEMPVYLLNENSESDKLIMYLHGGAFINQPLSQHFKLIDKIAQLTETTVVFPFYPRLPNSGEVHCLTQLESYLEKLLEENPDKRFILMGDSAGGWLALSLAIFLRNHKKKTLDHLILFSPWCDLSMSRVDERLEKKDPILSYAGLRCIGNMWMENADKVNDRGFRINDSLKDIGDIRIYVGSHEIFLTQAQILIDITNSDGVNLKLKEVKMMIHDFILFPFKESKEILSEVAEIINKN